MQCDVSHMQHLDTGLAADGSHMQQVKDPGFTDKSRDFFITVKNLSILNYIFSKFIEVTNHYLVIFDS